MKRALLLADFRYPDRSADECVAQTLCDIYEGLFQVDSRCDFSAISLDQLRTYHMIILASRVPSEARKTFVGALVAYVADGGCLLALGHGLLNDDCFELKCVQGAALIAEGTPCLLDVIAQSDAHPISRGIESFSLTEPASFFEMDPILDSTILLSMLYARRAYPIAWCHGYAWGKVACLTIGRIPESYLPQVRNFLWRCGCWFLNRL